jgi:hypothetical protein
LRPPPPGARSCRTAPPGARSCRTAPPGARSCRTAPPARLATKRGLTDSGLCNPQAEPAASGRQKPEAGVLRP